MAEKDLGYRRVQCTGRGSYIISLPKEWVQDLELKRGSEIAFNIQPDSTLTLVPRKIQEKEGRGNAAKPKEYYINIDPKETIQSTLRMIRALIRHRRRHNKSPLQKHPRRQQNTKTK